MRSSIASLPLALAAAALAAAGCEPAVAPGTPGAHGAASPGPGAVPAPAASQQARSEAQPDVRLRELEKAFLERTEAEARERGTLRAATDERIARLERELAEARGALADTRAVLDETRSELRRARRAIDGLQAASPIPNLAYDVPRIEGRVLSLDRSSEGPRVLLDVGRRQGVEPRFEFTIAHAGRPIAKVAIDRVDSEVSSGRVVYAKEGESIREGDLATTRP